MKLIFAGLEADRFDFLAGSMLTGGGIRGSYRPVELSKKAELDCLRPHGSREAVEKTSVAGSSGPMRRVLSWKGADSTIAPLAKNERIEVRLVPRDFANPAQTDGQLVNTARMGRRGSNQMVATAGAAKG